MLERALADGQAHLLSAEKVFFHLGYEYVTFRTKLHSLVCALFLKEVVTSFYFLLAGATALLLYLSV